MKILVTGAHFTPAIAVIEQLKKIDLVEVVYVGRKTTLEGDNTLSVESQVLPSKGVKFIPLITGRLQRNFTIYTVPSLLKIPVGVVQSVFIILSEKPSVVLSFGGYVAVPIVLISWLFSIPIILHEQTLVFGLANKISSFFADKIAVSFEESSFKGEKVVLTGNPLRQEITKISPGGKIGKKLPEILVIGGNQGSHIINLAIEGCLEKLTKKAVVFHQTGDSKFSDYERLKKNKNPNYRVFKFMDKGWEKILANSDLVICRAGINTLLELANLGKPALVIPLPYLYQDEQNKNAKYFAELGLVKILPQSQLSSQILFQKIKKMLRDLSSLKETAKKARFAVIPDGAKRLALETILLARGSK